MLTIVVLAIGLATAAAGPAERIVGGSVTTIENYPYMTVLLRGPAFRHICGGSIINDWNILTAAHCVPTAVASNFRCRVGSTYANSGGTVVNINWIRNHHNFDRSTLDSDISLMRTANRLTFSNAIRAASIARYDLADNTPVYATGWGATSWQGPVSHNLRHVQIWTVNKYICRQRYAARRFITENMLCSGWLDVGGRDQCSGDSGGPLLHHHNIVGVCSFGFQCAHPHYPGVNVRVSRFVNWILANL